MSFVKPLSSLDRPAARRAGLVVCMMAVAAALGALLPGAAQSAFPGDNGRIAYQSNSSGDTHIYSMTALGGDKTRLTNAPDYHPNWSADGKQIVFARYVGNGNREIYKMDADGGNQERLTHSDADIDDSPAWSPDGDKIAFVSQRPYVGSDIYVIDADGNNQTRLTDTGDNDNLNWSPNGKKIVFDSYRQLSPGHTHIYVMDVDGSNQRRLTSNDTDDFDPAWSPDGNRIVFARARLECCDSSIWTMGVRGE